MKKILLLIMSLFALGILVVTNRKNNSFAPSPTACGAAISRNGIIEDSFERGVQCMLAGHKDVYFGNIAGIIYDRIPEQYAKQEIQLITLPDGGFILYTKKGAHNAKLFAKQFEDESARKNHYLAGHLLGYSEEDINYFYERNKFSNYEQDKSQARIWLGKNSQ